LLGLSDGRVLLAPQTGDIPLPTWMLGDGGDGHFDDLPFFLIDQRPQGFLGRQIAHALSAYPDDPRRWITGQVLEYMLRESADLPGNLLVGQASVETFEHWSPKRLSPKAYASEAKSILAGKVPGSSAGGEQPKFLAEVDGRQVLVKFSPAGSDPAAERWRDLLVAEHLALVTLASGGIDAAESRITESGGRIFLETVRFDRMGNRGRLPAVSLEALDAEYSGRGTGWIDALSDLHHRHLVPTSALEVGRLLDTFGALIENNDRHLGNLALQPDVAGAFTLAPAYDMLPMRHAPARSEVLPTPAFRLPVQKVADQTWQQAIDRACEFWQRVATDSWVSTGFQEIAAERASIIYVAPSTSPLSLTGHDAGGVTP
jgi:hypothetical protein